LFELEKIEEGIKIKNGKSTNFLFFLLEIEQAASPIRRLLFYIEVQSE